MIGNDWVALGLTLGLAIIWLRFNDFLAFRGWISGQLSRKIIHLGTGPIFVLCWLFFSDAGFARWLAALVPGAITMQFVLVGAGIIQDEQAVRAMSRTGDRREVLRGPLLYGMVFVVLTLLFWKNSPVAIVALMLLCGGDGLADIVGKRLPSATLPWSPRKTLLGSLGVFFGGAILSILVVSLFVGQNVLHGPLIKYLPGIFVISFAGMVVESLPWKDIDNLTVPVVATLLGLLFWG
ncbi:dolichol kinase [Anaerolinea thermolimosa]|uniref:diacylglycerol/polyprenol kinase family protein n=1 Tax=Anaerolinea thermolimosa TaxID=229919 RepID=UPI000783F1F6|nr:phosphatidate cytidylyltransferase [Anaerolinea thermolimosa]GAP06663.1 dolichol kinase [Anaerolinea thermolimosa]